MSKKAMTHKKPTKADKNKLWCTRFFPETLIVLGVILAAVAIFAAFIISSQSGGASSYDPSIPDKSIGLEVLTSPHIEPGEAPSGYNSTPPTSGVHYFDPAPWIIYAVCVKDFETSS